MKADGKEGEISGERVLCWNTGRSVPLCLVAICWNIEIPLCAYVSDYGEKGAHVWERMSRAK